MQQGMHSLPSSLCFHHILPTGLSNRFGSHLFQIRKLKLFELNDFARLPVKSAGGFESNLLTPVPTLFLTFQQDFWLA